jgi:ribosomal protein S18 acetylase RimI-like enzyme
MHAVGGVPSSAVAAGRRDARAPRVSRSRRALALRRRAQLGAVADARAGSDARTWRVRQVYGDGKVLLDQLREVADLLADGFNASGRSSKDLLNGLVQKVRWSGGNFICLVADDGSDGSAMVGACDLTLLPAGGDKKSKEGIVADVPTQLGLPEDAHFLYLTGMVVPVAMRRGGIGDALLREAESVAERLDPKPTCVALHVRNENGPALGLYSKAGYVAVADSRDGAGGGDANENENENARTKTLLSSFPLKFPSGGALGFGKKPATRDETLMVKWLSKE